MLVGSFFLQMKLTFEIDYLLVMIGGRKFEEFNQRSRQKVKAMTKTKLKCSKIIFSNCRVDCGQNCKDPRRALMNHPDMR